MYCIVNMFNSGKCKLVKKNKSKNKLVEIISLFIIAFIINIIGLKYTNTLIFTIFFAIIPIVILTVRHKEIVGLVVSIFLFLSLVCLFPAKNVVVSFIAFSIIGLTIGYCLRNKFNLKTDVVIGGIAYIVVICIDNLIFQKFYGINVIQQVLVDNVVSFIETNKSLIQNLFGQEGISKEKAYVELFNGINAIFVFIPAFLTAVSFCLSYFNILISSYFISKFEKKPIILEPFSEFRLPLGVGLVFILSQILIWNKDLRNDAVDSFAVVFSNMYQLISFGFMVQGLSLADYWIKKTGLKGVLRVIVYCVGGIILFPFAIVLNIPFILVLAGILDYIMNFRKLETD